MSVTAVSNGWRDLHWTEWRPFDPDAVRHHAPSSSGVYRLRRTGDTSRMTYIGQTARTLRERLGALVRGMLAAQCPFNDPHTAAPYLWLLNHEERVRLEFSCAVVDGPSDFLRGTEDMLLWRHRVELGQSTEANYGRFYPGWSRPTNRSIHGLPGRAVEPSSKPHHQPDYYDKTSPALLGDGPVLSAAWWERCPLTSLGSLPRTPAIYCIFDQAANALHPIYVGETGNLAKRVTRHAAVRWPIREPCITHLPQPPGTPKHVLHELESDVLGWHFSLVGAAPPCQYRALASLSGEEGRKR